MKPKLLFLISMIMIFSLSHAKNLTIQKCTTAPIIDGNSNEDTWTNVSWQDMDMNKGENQFKNNSAKFKMTYDDYFLYVLVNVEDATIDTSQSINVWEKDGIELSLTLDTSSHYFHLSSGENEDWYLRKVFGREMTDWKNKGHIALEQTTTNGYTQEWKLSWDSLITMNTKKEFFDKGIFRFEIANNDNDGEGRNSQLFWNFNQEGNYTLTKYFGYIILGSSVSNNSVSNIKNYTSFYPNPARDNIRIISNSDINRVEIYSLNGQLMLNRITSGNAVSVNLTGLEQNTYILKVQTDKEIIINKLFIIK